VISGGRAFWAALHGAAALLPGAAAVLPAAFSHPAPPCTELIPIADIPGLRALSLVRRDRWLWRARPAVGPGTLVSLPPTRLALSPSRFPMLPAMADPAAPIVADSATACAQAGQGSAPNVPSTAMHNRAYFAPRIRFTDTQSNMHCFQTVNSTSD
jgi:hypothetical protein